MNEEDQLHCNNDTYTMAVKHLILIWSGFDWSLSQFIALTDNSVSMVSQPVSMPSADITEVSVSPNLVSPMPLVNRIDNYCVSGIMAKFYANWTFNMAVHQ